MYFHFSCTCYDGNKSIIFLLIVACMYICLSLQQVHFGVLALHLLLKNRLWFRTQYMHAGVALQMSHDYYLYSMQHGCLVTIIMCRIIVNNSEGAGTQTRVCTWQQYMIPYGLTLTRSPRHFVCNTHAQN